MSLGFTLFRLAIPPHLQLMVTDSRTLLISEEPVILVEGDGGFAQNLQEIGTVALNQPRPFHSRTRKAAACGFVTRLAYFV